MCRRDAQRLWTTKEDSVFPTVSQNALLITATFDAMEHQCVATVDIPGDFLQSRTGRKILIKLSNNMARLLALIEKEKYATYIVYEKGKPVLYYTSE